MAKKVGEVENRMFFEEPAVLEAGGAKNFDVHMLNKITIITGAGATATYSRVDSMDAVAHTTGVENGTTVPANTKETIDVDWPFFRVSVAGGTCRVGAI